MIKIKINNKEIQCEAGEMILEVAKKNGIEIPSFCYHPDFCVKGNCRVCVVEIAGQKKLTPSCATGAQEGMEIFTNTERVTKVRDTNIELIYAEHIEKCATCIWRFECKILHYAQKFGVKINYFKDRKAKRETYKFDNAVELDASQCIDCRNCVDACAMMGINYLEIKNKGYNQEVVPSANKRKKCILCGQCAVHCPVSAAQEQASWQEVESAIRDPKLTVVAQMPKMIRASIFEDFDEINTPQPSDGHRRELIKTHPNPSQEGNILEMIAGGLRKIGFDYVFLSDNALGEMVEIEAREFGGRVRDNRLPMLSAHCSAWVNYIERIRPELKGNLSQTESSHIISGRQIKKYLSKEGIDEKNIIVVSIVPCTAKKFEITRFSPRPVDAVLTFRELVYMLKKARIDLMDDETHPNPPMAIGGKLVDLVSDSRKKVIDSLSEIMSLARRESVKLVFKETGIEGVKEAKIKIGAREIRIAKVVGIKNVDAVLDKLDNYDYIDVLSCPDGCFGGGGQPIPTSAEIRKKRMEAM